MINLDSVVHVEGMNIMQKWQKMKITIKYIVDSVQTLYIEIE